MQLYTGDDKEDIEWLIRQCIYSYPQNHYTWRGDVNKRMLIEPHKALSSQSPGTGFAIGSLLSQDVIALLVNKALRDTYAINGFLTINFVDDTETLCIYKEPLLYTIPDLRKCFAEVGLVMNERKFYLQEVRKGAEFLGVHIRQGRLHVNRKTIRNMYADIVLWNEARGKHLHAQHFCQCVNSFFGIFKRTTSRIELNKAITHISPEWWYYIRYDSVKRCLHPLPQYKEKSIIIQKLKLYDTERKRRSYPGAA